MNYNEILDSLVEDIEIIPNLKKYWLIRTQSGTLFDTFIENNFVGLDHREVSLRNLSVLRRTFLDNNKFLDGIREVVKDYHKDEEGNDDETAIPSRRVSLIANQIYKFYQNVKKGDIVVIPSYSSSKVAFGIVKESNIAEFTESEIRKFDFTTQFLNKRVEWVANFDRSSLDPNIFKMFTSHQAINDVSKYADVIERSLQDFFILDNEAHLIINVQKNDDIKAKDLFGLGYSFLEIFDDLADELGILGVSSDDLEVKVNVNSPGKIDLKSNIKKTTVFAGIILLVCGGGYVAADGTSLKTDGIKSLLEAISNFRDREQNRDLKVQIFNKYKDSMKVKTPDDMIKLMKQVDENKDLPK